MIGESKKGEEEGARWQKDGEKTIEKQIDR